MTEDLDGCDEQSVCRSDSSLMHAVRVGDRDAFGELYRRYHACAHSFACRLLGTSQGADDLVAEAFTKVLNRIVSGGGPATLFRAYLLTTVRTTFYKQLAVDRLVDRQADLSEQVVPVIDRDPLIERLDADLALRALESLPDRWRTVLVQLEIEKKPTTTVAGLLGIHPNALAALAFRAREGLRVAYAQMHVKSTGAAECSLSASNLAAWLCGRLGRGLRVRVQRHIATCGRCTSAAREVSELLTQLRRTAPLTVVTPEAPNLRLVDSFGA